MKLLLLGGTQFLGRHVAELALGRGHDVSAFTRGRRPVPAGVRQLVGDRDPRLAPGLSALEGRRFDAVIDTSGYVPRVVAASASVLEDCGRYLFVSSLSVIAKADRAGLDESAPVATLHDTGSEDVPKDYGALKAACERLVVERFGERATIVRPGLIVGPYDDTDRFGYWPARFVHPALLGDRAAHAVVPAPPQRPVQFVDARDLAMWMLDLVESGTSGTFNACSPAGQWTFDDVVTACLAVASDPPTPLWVPEHVLATFHVQPWTALPLWIPSSDADSAGFMLVDCSRAQRAGLATRPLADTVSDTAAWLARRDNETAWKHVLSDSRERQIVSACAVAPAQET